MKKLFLICSLFAITFSVATAQDYAKIDKSVMDAAYFPSSAPHRTFAKTAEEKAALTPKIRITYSRPLAKGRKIFGELLKFGEAWRIGANESTEAIFMTDVMIGKTKIAAGRYSMIIVPTADSWTLKINTELDGWGNYGYNPEADIASITVPVAKSKEAVEALSMVMYEKSANLVHLKIGWDDSFAEFPINLK